MATNMSRRHMLHPVHAVLLASSFPLFLGALLSDWAYSNSYVVQWLNFAAWLNVACEVAGVPSNGRWLPPRLVEGCRVGAPQSLVGSRFLLDGS